jgi:hypothetical protein
MTVRAIVTIASISGLLVTAAIAQQFAQPANTACNAANRGTVNCPTYTAPATAVPRAPMDGSMTVPANTSTVLFNGAVPPNGFMIQQITGLCFVNDDGPASEQPAVQAGFYFSEPAFITPPGYKPIGAVSVICGSATYVAARGW